jgi:hypothetical protein
MKFALKETVKRTSIILPIYMKQSSQWSMTMRVQRVTVRVRGTERKMFRCKACGSLSNTFASQRDNIILFIMEHNAG